MVVPLLQGLLGRMHTRSSTRWLAISADIDRKVFFYTFLCHLSGVCLNVIQTAKACSDTSSPLLLYLFFQATFLQNIIQTGKASFDIFLPLPWSLFLQGSLFAVID